MKHIQHLERKATTVGSTNTTGICWGWTQDRWKSKSCIGFVILFGILKITKSCGVDGEFDGLILDENYEKKYIYIYFSWG